MRPMKILAVSNLKGGCGKTTLAVNLACLAGGDRRVALVDADSQASAADWLTDAPVQLLRAPLDADSAGDVTGWMRQIRALTVDLVVIDCPPHLSAVTGAALGLADLVLVPCGPSASDVRATARTVDLIRQARQARGENLPACLIVPNRIDRRSSTGKGIALALAAMNEPVGPALIARQAHADATGSGMWVGDYAGRSSPATADLMALWRAVEPRMNP
jgi:chromosome partitioning protein